MVKKRDRRPARIPKIAFNAETIEKFFQHGLHVSTRTIYIGSVAAFEDGGESGVDAKMAEQAIKGIHLLEQISRKKEIIIIMNNPGGSLYHSLAVYDAIRHSPCPTTIKVFGVAMSGGSIILQAGGKRIIAPHTTVMIHHGQCALEGTFDDVRIFMKEWEREIEIIRNIWLKRIREKHPRFTQEKMKRLLERDTYLSAHEALELGLADIISET